MLTGVHVFTTFTSLQRYWLGLVSCMAQLVEYRMMHALLSGVFSVAGLSTAVSDKNNNNNHIDSHLTTVGSSILIEFTAK